MDVAVLTETHRTAVVTMVSSTAHDEIRLCHPECRDDFLRDLGLSGHGGGWAFPARGRAEVVVDWSGIRYQVTWASRPTSGISCDLCGDEWQHRPLRVRTSAPPTEAQLRARAEFAARVRAQAPETLDSGDETPPG